MKKYILRKILFIIMSFLALSSCKSENCLQFDLLEGRAQQPSNIYLLFSVETCRGIPKAGISADEFEIYEDGELISIFEGGQTILPRPRLYTLATVLLLDLSGSILESATFEPLKSSAQSFVSQVAGEDGQEVAIYLFDGRETIKQLVAFTNNIDTLNSALESLSKEEIINDPEYDISTNLNGAVIEGIAVLNDKKKNAEKGKLFAGTLITFTDGTDRAHRFTDRDAVNAVKTSIHSSFSIGLGGEIDEIHLRSLGPNGFVYAENASDLEEAFNQIAQQVRSESEKYYILGYCTPSRKGNHRVTLKVTNYSGSLSYSFNAEGFEGGCDPEDIVLTTTTTIREPLCAFAEIYGEHSHEVRFLRDFRDNVLAKSPEGRLLIEQYYRWSPELVIAMREDDELREQLEDLSNSILPLLQ